MDTRTGYVYTPEQLLTIEKIPLLERQDPFHRTHEQFKADLVPVKNVGLANCPHCHGTGSMPKGLNSKRFKPCKCVS